MKRRLVLVLIWSVLLPGVACAQADLGVANPTTAKAPQQKPLSDKDDVNAIGTRKMGGQGLGNWYSLEKEIAIGTKYSKTIKAGLKFIHDPVITEYVNRLGQNLARNSDAKVPLMTKVIDSGEVNAFSLPGGYLYIDYRLILEAGNEAELAGTMAHEIAHIAARHATRQMTRSKIFQLAAIPLVFVGGGLGYALQTAVGVGVPMSMLKFSRGFEAEADYLALEYLYAAGYDPQAFISLLERFGREEPKSGKLDSLLSTHPKTSSRVRKSQDEIARILPPRDHYIVTTSDFDDVKDYLTQLSDGNKGTDQRSHKPTLRRKPASPNGDKPGPQGDDRPTLRRRPID